MLHGYPVYVVRQIRANERHLVEEQLKEAKRRILWQQMYDGFFTYRHYGIALKRRQLCPFPRQYQLYPNRRLYHAHQRGRFCR